MFEISQLFVKKTAPKDCILKVVNDIKHTLSTLNAHQNRLIKKIKCTLKHTQVPLSIYSFKFQLDFLIYMLYTKYGNIPLEQSILLIQRTH